MKSNQTVGFVARLRSKWYGAIDWAYAHVDRYFSPFRIVLLLISFQLIDGLLTGFAVQKYGTDLEANGLARIVFANLGVWPGIYTAKAFALVVSLTTLAIAYWSKQKKGRPRKLAVLGAFACSLISFVPLVMWAMAYYYLLAPPELVEALSP